MTTPETLQRACGTETVTCFTQRSRFKRRRGGVMDDLTHDKLKLLDVSMGCAREVFPGSLSPIWVSAQVWDPRSQIRRCTLSQITCTAAPDVDTVTSLTQETSCSLLLQVYHHRRCPALRSLTTGTVWELSSLLPRQGWEDELLSHPQGFKRIKTDVWRAFRFTRTTSENWTQNYCKIHQRGFKKHLHSRGHEESESAWLIKIKPMSISFCNLFIETLPAHRTEIWATKLFLATWRTFQWMCV